jgi:hypothetical protein
MKLYVDGVERAAAGTQPWPTEIDPEARLNYLLLDSFYTIALNILTAEAAGTRFTRTPTQILAPLALQRDQQLLPQNRIPILFPVPPVGQNPVWVGGPALVGDPARESFRTRQQNAHPATGVTHGPGFSPIPATGHAAFLGLVDNIVFQNRLAIGKDDPSPKLIKRIPAGEEYVARYDTFRPSSWQVTDALASKSQDALYFTKHTRSLEWQRPIRLASYAVTAWTQHRQASQNKFTLVDLGEVALRFGWARGSGSVEATLFGDTDGDKVPYDKLRETAATGSNPATDPMGWTRSLQQEAFNALTNGFLVPSRDGADRGFLTQGKPQGMAPELYFYALEITPAKLKDEADENQIGPRMAPVVDDVSVVYAPWGGTEVVQEDEIDDAAN